MNSEIISYPILVKITLKGLAERRPHLGRWRQRSKVVTSCNTKTKKRITCVLSLFFYDRFRLLNGFWCRFLWGFRRCWNAEITKENSVYSRNKNPLFLKIYLAVLARTTSLALVGVEILKRQKKIPIICVSNKKWLLKSHHIGPAGTSSLALGSIEPKGVCWISEHVIERKPNKLQRNSNNKHFF